MCEMFVLSSLSDSTFRLSDDLAYERILAHRVEE